MARYVGKRIVPKHCGYWDNSKEYEMESVVYDQVSGNSYISRKTVPVGTDISQTEYWALCSDFNMQMDLLEKHFTATEQRIVADNDATEAAIRENNAATAQTVQENNAQTRQHVDESLEETTQNLTETVNNARCLLPEPVTVRQKSWMPGLMGTAMLMILLVLMSETFCRRQRMPLKICLSRRWLKNTTLVFS